MSDPKGYAPGSPGAAGRPVPRVWQTRKRIRLPQSPRAVSPPIDVRTILSRPTTWLGRSPLVLLALPAVFYLPSLPLDLAGRAATEQGSDGLAILYSLASAVLGLIGGVLATGWVIAGAGRMELGWPVTVRGVLGDTLRRFWALLGIAIVSGLIIAVGCIAVVIPGVIAATGLFVATPGLMIESLGVGDALSRSWDMTRGNRWRVFRVLFVLILLVVLLAALLGMLGALSAGDDQALESPAGIVVTWVLTTLFNIVLTLLQVATYFELARVRGELPAGTRGSIEATAAVFD